MSTRYESIGPLSFNKLREQVPTIGLKIAKDEQTEDFFGITDDVNYLWCSRVSQDDVDFCQYDVNYGADMLERISLHFGVEIISEHDDRFYGGEDYEQIEESDGEE